MPVIPSFTAQRTPQGPRVSPSAFSVVSEAQASGIQGTMRVIDDYERQQQAMAAEKERLQRAERDIKVLEATNGIDIDTGEIAESFRERTDYENFDTDIEKHEKSIRDKYMQTAGNDKVLQAAIARTLNAKVSTLRHAVSTKKFDVMKERGLGAFETRLNQSLQDYAGTDPADQQTRDLILADVEVGLAQLASHRFIDPAQQEARLQKFINESEETRAEQLIDANPQAALGALSGGSFGRLDPGKRQAKITQAKTRIKQNAEAEKVAAREAERDRKEAEQDAHDNEERILGDLFVKKNYAAIIPFLSKAKHLKGDEMRTWTNAVNEITKAGGQVDKTAQAGEIVIVNDMIAKKKDPAEIRRYIVSRVNFSPENKEQYLNKLETAVNSELNEGRNSGYDTIKGLVFPKEGINASFQNTPLQTERTADAQMALDAWIDRQTQEGKYISKADIVMKAKQLGQDYSISFKEMMEYKKKLVSGSAKKEVQQISAEDRQKIDTVYDDNKSITRSPANDKYILEQIRKAGK